MKELAIGDVVDVVNNDHYAGHWGRVVATNFVDDEYLVSGGSIGDGAPMFGRSELRPRVGRGSPLCGYCHGTGRDVDGSGHRGSCPTCLGTGNRPPAR